VPAKKRKKNEKLVIGPEMFRDFTPPRRRDSRPVTLKVDLAAVVVRSVKSVSFVTDDEQVDRRRVDKLIPKRGKKLGKFPF
jgi:hypothetical protein